MIVCSPTNDRQHSQEGIMPNAPTQPTPEQMRIAEERITSLNLPADQWIITDKQTSFGVNEVAGNLFGMRVDAVRGAADRQEIPYSTLINRSVGWRLDRLGLMWYLFVKRFPAEAEMLMRGAEDQQSAG